MKILDEKELAKDAEQLIRAGRMPTLAELCKAVLEVRRDYTVKIRRARRERTLVATRKIRSIA